MSWLLAREPSATLSCSGPSDDIAQDSQVRQAAQQGMRGNQCPPGCLLPSRCL